MPVMLRAHIKRHDEFKSSNIMLQSASVSVLNKIIDKALVSLIKFRFFTAKRNPSRIDDGKVTAEMINVINPADFIAIDINRFRIFTHSCSERI